MDSKLDNSKLIVNYLPHSVDEATFKAMFEKIGPLESIKLMRNKAGESLAYGFVSYKSATDGLRAISVLNGVQREGKTLKVSVAKPKHMRETTNLYVAGLPEDANEESIRNVFEQYGEVNNCKVVTHQETGLSRGVAFVLFSNPAEAELAIRNLNGTIFPGTDRTIMVKVKDEPKSSNPDLYVANVPKAMDEETLKSYFNAYGEVRTCKIVRDQNTGSSKGIAFIHFSKRKESEDAIAGLHDTRLPGSTQNLIVKYKEQKELVPDMHSAHGYYDPWAAAAATPPGFGADANGYTREEMVTSPTGEVKRVIHHYVGVPGSAQEIPGTQRENGGGPMRRATYGANRYNPTSAIGRGAGVAPHPPPGAAYHHPYAGARFTHEDAKAQPSHQLFVYNLGPDADDAALYDLFAPFGAVTKVFPMRDPETQQCKGFGFVEMPDYDAAVLAIQALNGMPFKLNQMKPLKVDFKTQRKA